MPAPSRTRLSVLQPTSSRTGQTAPVLRRSWNAADPILFLFVTASILWMDISLPLPSTSLPSSSTIQPLETCSTTSQNDFQYGSSAPSIQGRLPLPKENVPLNSALLVNFDSPIPWWRHYYEPAIHCPTMPGHEQGSSRAERSYQLPSQLRQCRCRDWCCQVAAREEITYFS